MALAITAAAIFGAIIGSFLNVVIWRVPRGESLVKPGSQCPGCHHAIRAWDNIPVLSWLILRGRCRDCGAPISARYPLVEFATGALAAGVVAANWDDPLPIALGLVLVLLCVPVALIDYDVQKIPNVLLAPAAVAALVLGVALDIGFVPEQLIAAAIGGGFFLAAALLKPGGMGMGDVKLVGTLGLLLGRALAPAVFIALIAGVVVSVVIVSRVGVEAGRKTKVPFGVFLSAGALIAVFIGDQIVAEYLDRF
jgi:leader peptidase (prepilin peptidase)/N-methyltransferase